VRLYLDTCVLNDAFPLVGLATGERIRKGHLKKPIVRWAKEYAALYHVLDLDDQWDLTFGTSGETLEEIRRYQPKNSLCAAKKSFLEQMQNELFENFVRKCEAVPNRRPSDVLRRIESVVGAGPDAMHLYSAIVAGWDFFITTDFQTIAASGFFVGSPQGLWLSVGASSWRSSAGTGVFRRKSLPCLC